MVRPSRQLVLATAWALLIIGMLVASAVAWNPDSDSYYLRLDELEDSANAGDRVRVGGVVVSFASDKLVLKPEGASTPTVTVLIDEHIGGMTIGPGIVAVCDGVLERPDLIVDASVLTPTGPTRFEPTGGN